MSRTLGLAAPVACAARVVVAIALLAAGAGVAPLRADEPLVQQVTADGGAFRYRIPGGWELRRLDHVESLVALAPRTPGTRFRSNVNVVWEPLRAPLDDYVTRGVREFQAAFPGARQIARDAFVTESGHAGVRLVFETPSDGQVLWQAFYVFGVGGKAYVLAGSTLREEADAVGPLMQLIARSVTISSAASPEPPAATVAASSPRLLAPDGRAELVLPVEWEVSRFSSGRETYRIAHPRGARDGDVFPRHILLSGGAFFGTPAQYLEALSRQMPQVMLVPHHPMSTSSGARGLRIAITNMNRRGDRVAQVLYLFSTEQSKYLVVGTTAHLPPDEDIERFDRIVRDGFSLQ